ncbi:hypothetical protein RJ641_012733 [Dillenia turbinata]|uniref:ABC-2 type transporter transmembrane domain-containing protein n=1 Tax=Dillenia turbinata TaxID=194707 RepID=A0AAN8V2Q1_9MAGN
MVVFGIGKKKENPMAVIGGKGQLMASRLHLSGLLEICLCEARELVLFATDGAAEIPVGAAFLLIFGAVLYPMARLHPTLSRFGKFRGIVTVESFAASAIGLTVGAMVPSTEASNGCRPISYDKNLHELEHQMARAIFFRDRGVRDTVIAQSRVILFWYCTTYLLKKNNPKYQLLEPPLEQIQPNLQLEPPLEQIQPNLQLEPLDTDKEEAYPQPETRLLVQVNPTQNLELTTNDQVLPFIFEGHRKMVKVLASRRDPYGREYDGQKVDENMIVLRKRIHEMKIAENDYVAPSHWMDWEKKYYYGNYDSDICEAVGMLQSKLMNTRPSLALGLVALVALSVPTSTVLLGFHLMKMINTMILAGFFHL